MKQERVEIAAGFIDFKTTPYSTKLDDILDFASRQNPKRGYLFVSKILGKHVPCKPSIMRESYNSLASRIGRSDRDTLLISMAETATGLGAGVADSLARISESSSVYYTQTTRHHLEESILLTIDESHSHAVDHIIYHPCEELRESMQNCERLVLVDDEISTGRTLSRLLKEVSKVYTRIKEVVIVSLVDWLETEDSRGNVFNTSIPIRYVSLSKGSFSFDKRQGFNPVMPENTFSGLDTVANRKDTGRLGLKMPMEMSFDVEKYKSESKVSVVGTGEHTFLPFLLAEELEKNGVDVVFQSTTRSPVMLGDAICSKIDFVDSGMGSAQYIYNLDDERKVIIIHENKESADACGLFSKVKAEACIL